MYLVILYKDDLLSTYNDGRMCDVLVIADVVQILILAMLCAVATKRCYKDLGYKNGCYWMIHI